MNILPLLSAILTAAIIAGPVSLHASSKGPLPAQISHGQTVDIKEYLVPGKTTIIDFTSKYCGPCVAVSPKLDKLHASRDDMVVVKIDINRPEVKGIDWRSPVARQYGIDSIPHFKVYGPDGKLVAEGRQASALVAGWLK